MPLYFSHELPRKLSGNGYAAPRRAQFFCRPVNRQYIFDSRLPRLPQAHNEYVMAEKRREEWELKNHREGEILEMVEIFEVCGCWGLVRQIHRHLRSRQNIPHR